MRTTRGRTLTCAFTAGFISISGCTAQPEEIGEVGTSASAVGLEREREEHHHSGSKAKARLIDADGATIGVYQFKALARDQTTPGLLVTAQVWGLTPGFHGTHLHANNDPANGVGCVPPAFTSTDGHLNPEGNKHGDHAGDLPVLMAGEDGSAYLSFITDRVSLGEVLGAAVIVHALPDNFHNIPVGVEPDRYTPNSPAATTLTDNTGNAGARVGCGVVE